MKGTSQGVVGEAATATGAALGIGGAATAAAISACCAGPIAFGPLIVSPLGASGAVAFVGLRAYTIPLLAFSGIAVAASFWMSSRNGSRCSVPAARRASRTLLWLAGIVWLGAAALAFSATIDARAATQSTAAFAPLTAADQPFRAAFNRRAGAVRVVELVSPTCPYCLDGVSKIQQALFASNASKDLAGFIIWVPMLGGKASNVSEAMSLEPDPRVMHYWDGSNDLGITYERLLPVAGGPAWDVYMLFPRGVVWNGSDPPKPTFWMHQLSIKNAPFLDTEVFAARARQMLDGATRAH